MIESFKMSKLALLELLEFIRKETDMDFYYTHENSRIYITDIYKLKKFLNSSESVYVLEDKGEYKGIILLWKSLGGGKKRYYVKIRAANETSAKDLLTVLIWNTSKEMSVKIRKDNKFLSVLRNKGFRFMGDRGWQILLSYKPQKEKHETMHRLQSYN